MSMGIAHAGLGFILVFAALAGLGMSDPPISQKNDRKHATSRPTTTKPAEKNVKRKATSRRSEPRSTADLTADEKKIMKTARYHVFRLKKEAIKRFTCPTCKGTGKVHQVVRARAPGGMAHVEDVDVVCPDCGGAKVRPSPGFHEAMAAYNKAKLDWEMTYYWEPPLNTGLEQWLFSHVREAGVIRLLNIDGYRRLGSGATTLDDVFLVGVQAFGIDENEDGCVVQALLEAPDQYSAPANLMILFDRRPKGLSDHSCLLLMAYNEGPDAYETVLGDRATAQILTGIGVKLVDCETVR